MQAYLVFCTFSLMNAEPIKKKKKKKGSLAEFHKRKTSL